MDDNISFPFKAEYKIRYSNGKNKWSPVKVMGAVESEAHYEGGDYYVDIEYQEMIFTVRIDELRKIEASEETMDAIQVWSHRNKF